ncbi:CDP-diacylglycerol--glycerol-3-phosphate 3-phosphatidyltransferase [Polycladidibacter stylochi]|uniref:CDP-diacylglycerol--glycerol-3-phosphate 3-phosphatidyltransferase n=1 Tax=Polycladidibacter stylochi TaxID=1807766 RepID=UPI000835A202|nr:CDP-diacylglycerol--glycerol-3-phosphate 3-phosphatidyltransferase [Pseudovibrio stylochi]
MSRQTLFALPNVLTYLRILAVPAVVIAFYFPGHTARWVAFFIFAFAAITDFFDGYLARAWKQQSSLGKMLDPIADKLLVSVCLLILTWKGTIGSVSVIAALIILCREILVSGLREFLAALQVSVPVTKLAKWKTTTQLLALGFLLVGPAGNIILPKTTEIGITLLWISAILTIYTGYDYFKASIGHLVNEEQT